MTEPPASKHEPAVGQVVLGRYRIVRQLARGGMGVIYLGRNEGAAGFVRPVVIKRALHAQSEHMAELFAREARILSALRHPGIVSVLEFADEDGAHVMVLDYVHGFNLRQWYRFAKKQRDRFEVGHALFAVTQTLEALDYAHRLRGPDGKPLDIVHRDVKPSNILIDVKGHVQLSDFGVARTNTDATDLSRSDATLRGTFSYMAPELFRRVPANPCTDVYSAAVTLRELLVGKNEFQTRDVMSTVAKVINFKPQPIRRIRDDVSAELDDLLAHALAKDPEARPQTAAQFADDLRRVWNPPEDIAEQFAAAVERDFQDPAFPHMHKTDSLDDRSRAWVEYGGTSELTPELVELPLVEAASATVTERATPLPDSVVAPERSAQRPRWLWVAIAVAVLGAAGAAAYAMLADRGDEATPTVVMVRGDVHRAGTGDAQPPAPPPASGDLSAAFRRRQELVARCIEQHEPNPASLPALAIRFEIGADGAVTRATLEPESVADRPLGGCILRVARGTAFPPQPGPVAFRIPLALSAPSQRL